MVFIVLKLVVKRPILRFSFHRNEMFLVFASPDKKSARPHVTNAKKKYAITTATKMRNELCAGEEKSIPSALSFVGTMSIETMAQPTVLAKRRLRRSFRVISLSGSPSRSEKYGSAIRTPNVEVSGLRGFLRRSARL